MDPLVVCIFTPTKNSYRACLESVVPRESKHGHVINSDYLGCWFNKSASPSVRLGGYIIRLNSIFDGSKCYLFRLWCSDLKPRSATTIKSKPTAQAVRPPVQFLNQIGSVEFQGCRKSESFIQIVCSLSLVTITTDMIHVCTAIWDSFPS